MKIGYLSFFLLFFLTGCGLITDSLTRQDSRHFISYLENNETINELTFFKIIDDKNGDKEPKFWQVTGSVHIKYLSNFNKYITKSIGDMHYVGNGKNVIVVDPTTNKGLNSAKEWKNAKSLKIYEFGGGIIETIVYKSKSQICSSLSKKEPVFVRAVTNYYTKDDEFFTTITESNIINQKIKPYKLDYKFFSTKNKKEHMEFAKSQKFKEKVIDSDIKKQNRIIFNSICNQNMEK